MEQSILTSTKKVLGLGETYSVFDPDVLMHINAAFSVLNQLGVGPEEGFFIEDESSNWEDLELSSRQLSLVKTYVYLKTRMLFDPPGTSYLIEATNNQIKEYEWRLSVLRDEEKEVETT